MYKILSTLSLICLLGTYSNAQCDLIINPQAMPTNCFGECTGSVWGFEVSNGLEPYSFVWQGNGETFAYADVGGLCPGNYCLTITDAEGCTATGCIDVVDSPALVLSTSTTPTGCNNNAASGTATASPSGGVGAYSYAWDNGGSTQTIDNLIAGDYCVTVTDGHGCTTEGCVTVEGGLLLSLSAGSVSCFGDNDGSVTASATEGTLPYTFLWSNGSTLSGISGVSAGNYCVTVMDGAGCEIIECADVLNPALLEVDALVMNESCIGDGDGSITASGSGGTMPYSYTWGGGQTTPGLSNLNPGPYPITITDANGCQANTTLLIKTDGINECEAVETMMISGPGAMDGAIIATGTGGTLPHTYLWSDGQTTQEATGLGTGNFDVTITDGDGCQCVASLFIMDPGAMGDIVWDDDNVNGVQDAGELPMPGVFVTLSGTDLQGNAVQKTISTDDTGAYQFTNVRPGDYRILFKAPAGYSPTAFSAGPDTTIDSDIDATGSTPIISLGAGEIITNLDAGFHACIKIGDKVWNDINQNGMQDAGEPGVPDVLIEAYTIGVDHQWETSDDILRGSAISAPDGTFMIDCVIPSEYRLKINYNGLTTGDYAISTPDAGNNFNDNDFTQTGYTESFTVSKGTIELRGFDAGIYQVCNDFADAGTIEGHQTICYGENASMLNTLSTPAGGWGDYSYTWMMSTNADNINSGDWIEIDASDLENFVPGEMFLTTNFVRMAKRQGCDTYTKASNIVTVTIASPGTDNCVDYTDEITLEAYPNPVSNIMLLALDLPLNNEATLEVLNTTGKLMHSQSLPAGTMTVDIDFADYAGGIYIIKLKYTDTKVMTTLKAFKM